MSIRPFLWIHERPDYEVSGDLVGVDMHKLRKIKDLSYHQLMNGLLLKMLTVTPSAKLDPELAIKLLFTQFLMLMSFHYTRKQVLETCREMIMAWQMKEFERSNLPLIESRLKNIRKFYAEGTRWW